MTKNVLYESHPSMFRNQPLGFLSTIILCAVGVGFIILLVWWLRCMGTTLTVTSERTALRRGVLSKSIVEVWHQDVRNVQLYQSFWQRVFDVGHIGISSAGQGDVEIQVNGMPHPERVKQLIDQHRRVTA